jgi:peptidoglycan/LPS O-acetylase OafA/YrhL
LRALCNRCDTSFGIYICAGPIQQTLLCLIPALTPLWLSSIAFAIVLPLAFASWCFIEKPALALRLAVSSALKRRAPAFAFRAEKPASPQTLAGLVAAKV